MTVTHEAKQAFCATKGLTLNGAPAAVYGAKATYARVSDLKTGLSAEWSWEAVKYVIETKNGTFKTY